MIFLIPRYRRQISLRFFANLNERKLIFQSRINSKNSRIKSYAVALRCPVDCKCIFVPDMQTRDRRQHMSVSSRRIFILQRVSQSANDIPWTWRIFLCRRTTFDKMISWIVRTLKLTTAFMAKYYYCKESIGTAIT